MEPTFYEDSRYRVNTREEVTMRGIKRPMTLDLNGVNNNNKSNKKPRGNALLTSPDLHMLKLESPELEKLIMQQHAMAPNNVSCMYPKMDDRDQYSRDFPDALLLQQSSNFNLYQQPEMIPVSSSNSCNNNNMMPPSTMPNMAVTTMGAIDNYGYHHQQQQVMSSACNPMVSSTNCYGAPVNVSNGGYYAIEPMVSIKEEPQTVPCASPPDLPPRSPIDMEDQEKMKLERKRLRNRIAASKCRRRKLERIARLEDKVSLLKNENSELQNHVTRLKEHICHLKQQVLDHVRSGCDMMTTAHPSYNNEDGL